MFEKIVVGLDDRAEAFDALHLGATLADVTQGSLTVATVLPYSSQFMGTEAFDAALRTDSKALFARAREELGTRPFGERALGGGSPARALHDLLEIERSDLAVLGSSHRGPIGRIFPGGVTSLLLQGSPCPICVAPRGYGANGPHRLRRIVVGFDGGAEARVALRTAVELAQLSGATIRIIGVAEPPPLAAGYGYAFDLITDSLHRAVDEAVAETRNESGLEVDAQLLSGEAGPALARGAEGGADLMVVGSRAYGPIRRVFLGSASTALMREAPCPVLVVPRGANPAGVRP